MTIPSGADACTSAAVASAWALRAFLPRTGSKPGPTEMTSAPSSCSRMTVTQYSRSSNPSATSTTIFFPLSLIPAPFSQPVSILARQPQQFVHGVSGLVPTQLQGASQLRDGVGAPPRAEEAVGRLQVW